MPFTASHPAIVLPLTFLPKRFYSLTGLMIGAVTPDFEYFIRLSSLGVYGHTLWGVFWFDLPLGLLLCFLFHRFFKNPLIQNLPPFFQKRFSNLLSFQWNDHFIKNWHIVSLSVVIGTFSHLFWDSFTHYDGFFVDTVPLIKGFVPLGGVHWPMFFVLQHVSTVIGGIALLYAVYKLPVGDPVSKPVDYGYWGYSFLLTIIFFVARLAWSFDFESFTGPSGEGFSSSLDMHTGDIVVSLIACGLWAMGIVGAKRGNF